MKSLLAAVLVILACGAVSAQLVDQAELEEASKSHSLGIAPVSRPSSLLDLSKVRWSHRYSLSFFSNSAYSGSTGLLNTTMFYDFSSKLSLAVNLGIAHNAGALWGNGNNDATILPGFLLDYHPSDKFRMSIEVQTISGGYHPYYHYRPFRYGYFGP